MARTFKRQPFSVSTSSNAYAKPQMLIQGEFKGISDVKNDVLADQSSFASANNVYVDDNMLLVSRAPFKFYDREAYIVKEWRFGAYQLRLYKLLTRDDVIIDKPGTYPEGELTFTYLLKCISHNTTGDDKDTFEEMTWQLPVSDVGWDYEPKVTCADIEDKIFIWFAGFDLVVFNTTKLYFESGIKYLYLPIRSLVVNGIETPLEAENFLTPTGRRRYQYSALSSVNFEALVGKEMRVGLSGPMTEGISKYLYTTTIENADAMTLIYPHATIGNNYHVEIGQGLGTKVYLRYSEITKIIAVSFDGRYFETLPMLDNILGLPQLTEDATHVVAFTTDGVAWCKLFADESTEAAYSFSFVWDIVAYSSEIDTDFIPAGHFETREQFAYIFRTVSTKQINLVAEWPNGALGQLSFTVTVNDIVNDDIKLTTRYIAPQAQEENPQLLVGVLVRKLNDSQGVGVIMYHFTADGSKFTTVADLTDEFESITGNTLIDLGAKCRRCDLRITLLDRTSVSIKLAFSASLLYKSGAKNIRDCEVTGKYWFNTRVLAIFYAHVFGYNSAWFKYSSNGESFITNKYLYDGRARMWPETAPIVGDIINGSTLIISQGAYSWSGNIHKVTDDRLSLANGQIESGDWIIWKANAKYADEYLTPDAITDGSAERLHLFKIERITREGATLPGIICAGDYVRLTAYDKKFKIPATAVGNPDDVDIEVTPWTYPAAPADWTVGQGWPSGWESSLYPRPWTWKTGMDLPTGPVEFGGYVQVGSQTVPLNIDEYGVWLNVNGTLWTSQQSTENVLELDEYINTKRYNAKDGQKQTIDAHLWVPTQHKTLNEHYFSFEVDGRYTLQVTQTKRDEDKILSNEGADFLLYLPKRNEQVFTKKITNVHPIADNVLSVFTEQSIWNITVSTLDDGSTVYSAPILSKIPSGCRDGDDVMTALDGQALLLATPRGIAALAPQDFVATADNTMTYLSDSIQETYYRFYKDRVESTVCDGYDSNIKMLSYRYWLLFYRYMDREVLVFDMRTNAWWKWSVPYPIRQITSDIHLHLTLQIDYSRKHSFGGVAYIWKDHEDTEHIGTTDTRVELPTSEKSRKGYRDDVVENTLNGLSTSIYENEFIRTRKIVQYASPIIQWHFLSQKLHFNQINNYKAVKGITATLKGDDILQTILSTKTYRSLYHPEQSDIIQTRINESRTFVQRLNLMHVVNFQYEFTHDASLEEPIPLRLCTLSIKYEVKEGIR